jgi:dTDP-4-amino-4,6-dideoxygalactose transaminase
MVRAVRVPLLDLAPQYELLADEIRAEIDEVLRTQRFILGPKVKAFEAALARLCGGGTAIGMSSGTDALLAILMALGIGRGDAIITSAYTFFATAACAVRLGARPAFVDIDPSTYNLSPATLERFLSQECERKNDGLFLRYTGERIRAIVPVHLYGLCCEMNAITALAKQYGVPVIEDAAQAIGAEYPFASGTRVAGTMSLTGFFSFYPSKNLGAAGDAGAVICEDAELANRISAVRGHGMQPRYYHHIVGGNFRLDEIQAAILQVKLPHLKKWAAARRAAADFYRKQFTEAGLTNVITTPAEPYRGKVEEHHVYHQFVIRTPERDALRKHLSEQDIGSEIYYPLGLHLQACFRDLGYREGDLPETERAAKETLALPVYPELSREAQCYVVTAIQEFFARQQARAH